MKASLRKAYDDLYHGKRPPAWHQVDAVVRQTIESVESEITASTQFALRPDGRLILLINFRDLVLLPLEMVGSAELYGTEKLRADLRTVLNAAVEESRQPDGSSRNMHGDVREISAHAVVAALTRNWRELRLFNMNWLGVGIG